jgi:serine/threonine protein phosphatase PrpC
MKIHLSSHGLAREPGKPSSDAFGSKTWGQTVVAVLADGAGTGDPAREAAQKAVATLLENFQARPRAWSVLHALNEFAALLNRTLYGESLAQYERAEMVSTLAVVVIEGEQLTGLNLGDSPVYQLREGKLQQLSATHSDAERPNLLTKALGMTEEIAPYTFECQVLAGDVLCLCSDGVANHLAEAQFAELLTNGSSARRMVQQAQENAPAEYLDDASAIVIRVLETGKSARPALRELPVPSALSKGEKVDGYELLRAFQGGDRVWLAEKDGHRVVMKFAPAEAQESQAHLDAFIREVWNASRIDSEHVVRAWEPIYQTQRYYLMDFVDAPSLAGVLQARRLSVDSAIGLGKFLAAASQQLLRLDLAHGDIKPENILCVGDYASLSFKLVDLGSAAQLFSVTSRAGTASYLAPERFRNAPISERTEIFAFGVTLYQALTGALPYGTIERFQTPTFSAPKRPQKLNANLPPWLDTVITRAIARDPDKRYQHYSEFLADLNRPEKVVPFYEERLPLLERNPLAFYKTGFFVMLAVCIGLLIKLRGK